jgi:hypothetical protein
VGRLRRIEMSKAKEKYLKWYNETGGDCSAEDYINELEKQNEELMNILKEYKKDIDGITSETEDVKYVHANASFKLYSKITQKLIQEIINE